MLMIKRIVLHKMSVCNCACVLFGFGILHGYEGLVVSCGLSEAAKPWSWISWRDCVVRACESERESTPAVVMFGLLWAVCQHPLGWTMCFVCSMYICLVE